MNLLQRLFKRSSDQNRAVHRSLNVKAPLHEDVRSSASEDGEIILNLWYVSNGLFISSLRAKTYIASGSDEEKLEFLRIRANDDFRAAKEFPVPEDLKVTVKIAGGSEDLDAGKLCMHNTLGLLGGYPVLFREVIAGIDASGFRYDPRQAMMCITGIVKDKNGNLSVQIDSQEKL